MDDSDPATAGVPLGSRSARCRLPGSLGPPSAHAPPSAPAASAPPLGVRVRAGRKRAAPGCPREASCGTPLTFDVRSLRKDGAAEGGKVQHHRQGKRAARLGAAAPGRAALPLRSLGVHGVQGESWRRLRPLPPRVRTERPRPPESQHFGVRGAGGVCVCVCEGGSPSRGSTGARRCPAPHFSSRAVSSRGLVAADRLRAAAARAAAPGVVGVPGSVPAAPWGGAGPADTYPPWAAVGTGGSQRERRKGKRWGTKSVSCATSFTGAAVEITVGQGDGGWDRNGINQSRS